MRDQNLLEVPAANRARHRERLFIAETNNYDRPIKNTAKTSVQSNNFVSDLKFIDLAEENVHLSDGC